MCHPPQLTRKEPGYLVLAIFQILLFIFFPLANEFNILNRASTHRHLARIFSDRYFPPLRSYYTPRSIPVAFCSWALYIRLSPTISISLFGRNIVLELDERDFLNSYFNRSCDDIVIDIVYQTKDEHKQNDYHIKYVLISLVFSFILLAIMSRK